MERHTVADSFNEQSTSKQGYERFFEGMIDICTAREIDNSLGEELKEYVAEWLKENSLEPFDNYSESAYSRTYLGCYDLEQVVGNRFVVELTITTDLGAVAEDDDVEKAVSYLTVYEIVREVMRIKCRTIERVAQNIIHAVKEQFPQITEVECSVAKLAPPLGGKIGRVSVVLKG